MPTIYDNLDNQFLGGLRSVLADAQTAAFCVGYFHLLGWQEIADLIEVRFCGLGDSCCRILVGMHQPPREILREFQGIVRNRGIDGAQAGRLKRKISESFKEQLQFGVPSEKAKSALLKLRDQLRAGKVKVKSFLRHPLHAKLYLVRRDDPITPAIGFVGSSNFTYPGLTVQGELNVDVVDQDAAQKLLNWFENYWDDPFAIDLSDELATLIDQSWAAHDGTRPYLVYLKMAYFLSEEARQGEREFKLPKIFEKEGTPLLDFQARAVSLAAHYLYRRGGVLLGDVVGLGKTLMATALARIFQEDDGSNTLVICPPKLVPMWQYHIDRYQITGRVVSLGDVIKVLPELPRYRLLILDESHNLRNREGKRYKAIKEYIDLNEPRVVLLTATPFNKHYEDLSNQLRLFIDPNKDLHVRPERFFQFWASQNLTEADFRARYQTLPTSLRAFEQSTYPEDWRDLMRLFLVRRTRSFIIRHYADYDSEKKRYYVKMNGLPYYFPTREPKKIAFETDITDPNDQYARLFNEEIVKIIEELSLPRYGLAKYLLPDAEKKANHEEKQIIEDLTRAGRRLIGVCRTNLFKRLESSGHSFLLSVKRHILRTLVFVHALKHGLEIPLGVQDAALMDAALTDEETECCDPELGCDTSAELANLAPTQPLTVEDFASQAAQIYKTYASEGNRSRFKWIRSKLFDDRLCKELEEDTRLLLEVLTIAGDWRPEHDVKLRHLYELVTLRHPHDKLLIFTQFADTARYLAEQLRARGVNDLDIAVSSTTDPLSLARRFSPRSNGGLRPGEKELRILIATDVLAEGQNLQDCHIIVNFDLPWAIIRLIQRAGRVDRIGQRHDTILVYSFLPAEGVERIIALRERLFERLKKNQEVIGTDETFFGEQSTSTLIDIYTEKTGVLDDDSTDDDIDLSSLALQVWRSASKEDQRAAEQLPPLVSTTAPTQDPAAGGMISYLRFPEGTDTLVRVDCHGNILSQSPSTIFRQAACAPSTQPVPPPANHYDLIRRCVEVAVDHQDALGGQLGTMRSVARRIYERLMTYRQKLAAERVEKDERLEHLDRALELLFRYPMKESARDAFSRQLKLGITDDALADMLIRRAEEGQLCVIVDNDGEPQDPQIICSLGLRPLNESSQGNE